ncbi:DUF6440 family protein [Clostridium autoethanogenum]|uniref:DUF6440 family protein n=1 Tax=Clostridium autoethanogenum DSM 10061 TaxID=1341692 RepID=A0ABN4BIN3_9CLOT|nr:DUF6440 family protein [Clostridium autoethanogenum]AGY75745.1 DUF6440 family protein [Clostridium autoethanogenum DSM 10061]ALU35910.1 Hypothetical protein CLAU_1481 [Clostridium autoethanogenum DSM 10061]OVY52031.1 hypothetical protein WX72_00923 [Clostridium autoethanogenum]
MFGEKSNKRFEVIFKEGTTAGYKIIVDKETGVEYLFSYDGYAGGLTLLVDKDGKPIIKDDNK